MPAASLLPADCLCKLGLCGPDDLPALGLRVFPAYLDVARKLQRTYWLGVYPPRRLRLRENVRELCTYHYQRRTTLPRFPSPARRITPAEPAGSHGVWSLDDYQFLVFLFGSAQLASECRQRPLPMGSLDSGCQHVYRAPSGNSRVTSLALPPPSTADHPRIKPRSIHSAEVLEGFARDYMYLSAVGFISSVKFGAPFAEHSPILNDISELPSWSKVNEGLAKMYRGEVLGKLPVVQHFLFGSLFKADWTPSRHPCPPEAGAAHVLLSGEISDVPSSPEVPMDEPERAVAPWVTEPISLSGRFPRSPSSPGSSSAGSGGAFDPNITGMAPWARQTGRSPGASGSDRPSPHAHLAGATPGASIEGGSPGGQGPSTVTTFLEAFGPIPHVTPKQAEAAAAAAAAAAEEGQEGAGAGNGQATSEKSGPNTVSS